jgi:rsbT co-antagonist protein RsbR
MLEQTPAPQLRSLAITDSDIEHRKKTVGLDPDDIARIASIKDIVTKKADEYTDGFFRYLANLGEASALFMRREALDEAKGRKREHLIALVSGIYGRSFVEERIALGVLYNKYGLETRVFLGGFHHLMKTIGSDIMLHYRSEPEKAFQIFLSLTKIGFFDISILVDVLVAERQLTIDLQQEAIRELSTPVLQIRERLLILPIIGTIDSQRAKQLTDDLLRAIRVNRSKVVVMDITGVGAVDSKVANHLIQTVAAARLMGSSVIVTGLSAEVAQALVGLGVDLSKLDTTGDLQAGLEQAEHLLGYRMVRANQAMTQLQSA